MSAALERLFATVESRRGGDPGASYTARLLAGGPAAVAAKLREEAGETADAAENEPSGRVVAESADLLYHLLVLWAARDVTPEQVWAELARREGTSGLVEKAGRPAGGD